MTAVVASILLGLLIVVVAIGVPYWLTHRHLRPQHDPGEAQAYLEATGRTAGQVAARQPGRPFWRGGRAAVNWQAAHAGVDPETGEPASGTGKPGRPDGMG